MPLWQWYDCPSAGEIIITTMRDIKTQQSAKCVHISLGVVRRHFRVKNADKISFTAITGRILVTSDSCQAVANHILTMTLWYHPIEWHSYVIYVIPQKGVPVILSTHYCRGCTRGSECCIT